MTQPTPGPWKIIFGGFEGDGYAVIGSPHQNHPIANLEPQGYTAANAKLIAAAPEMLQALRDVSDAYQSMFDAMPVAWQTFDHIVSEAIKAATGEAP